MPSLRFANVVKNYGEYQAIRNVSFDIPDGEFVVIVGPSGSGKTTMLRAIGGLERVSSGHIYIGDRDVTHLPPKDRDIAFVFQNYALYAHLTRSEEHTSEHQSIMRISYAVFCLKK